MDAHYTSERPAGAAWRSLDKPGCTDTIASHGEPVHDRVAYEQALALRAWTG